MEQTEVTNPFMIGAWRGRGRHGKCVTEGRASVISKQVSNLRASEEKLVEEGCRLLARCGNCDCGGVTDGIDNFFPGAIDRVTINLGLKVKFGWQCTGQLLLFIDGFAVRLEGGTYLLPL